MKRKVGIVVDSTFGLPNAFVEKEKISVVPLKVIIEGVEHVDGTLDPGLVVSALQEKKQVKTSQPSPESFLKAYETQLESYDEVLCLVLSSTLSGTLNSANLAKTIIENDHVVVIDSETTISGGRYLVEKMIEFLQNGKSIKEAIPYLETLKDLGSLIFTVDNLHTLVQNGRLSKIQGFIGNVLKVKPILRFRRGVLDVEHKVRSFSNVLIYLVKEAEKLLDKGKVAIYISFVESEDKAKQLQHEIYQISQNVIVHIAGVISPVISAHVGLGGLGIYLTNE